MTKQEKLNRIYEVIANKELSFGCSYQEKIQEEILPTIKTLAFHPKEGDKFPLHYMKIIGHPVMIGDCLDYVYQEKFWNKGEWNGTIRHDTRNVDILHKCYCKVLELWEYKRLPIDEQSEGTIDYIHSLIK